MEVSDKICPLLKQELSSKTVLKSKAIFGQAFSEEIKANSADVAEYYKRLMSCFASGKFSKSYDTVNAGLITGNGKEYFTLRQNKVNLQLESGDNPSFAVKLEFFGKKKIKDTSNIEIFASLRLLNESRSIVKEYNLYPTPDFIKTLIKVNGNFAFTAHLETLWNPMTAGPFDDAATIIQNFEISRYFELEIIVKDSAIIKSETEQEKEYQEMIDEIQIK